MEASSEADRRLRIVVVGSINIDLVARCASLPGPGETVAGTEFSQVPGGKGANQAIAAARAGGRDVAVSMIGAVGSDSFADRLLAHLAASGVDIGHVRRAPGSSGIAHITVDARGENVIVVIPAANGTVTALTDAELDVVRAADLLMVQLEIPLAAVVQAAHAARAAGVPVLLNPSPVLPLPRELCSALTLAVVNEGEAAALGSDLDGIPVVVTTFGSRGARYAANGLAVDVDAPRVAAIDTTGAGDAFTGAFAVAHLADYKPREALRFACAAGALATTVRGATSPTRDQILSLATGSDTR